MAVAKTAIYNGKEIPMYYKVIRNRQVIDILDRLDYVLFQLKHGILLLCDESIAQGILSSDGSTAYHIQSLDPFPIDRFMTVSLEEITKTEYDQLKNLNMKTPEQIAQQVILELIERGVV